jgi:hypothetical protein
MFLVCLLEFIKTSSGPRLRRSYACLFLSDLGMAARVHLNSRRTGGRAREASAPGPGLPERALHRDAVSLLIY